jgi:hypothetical protein
MLLDLRHPFPCRAEVFWEITSDPAFMAAADDEAEIIREKLEERVMEDGRVFHRLRYTSRRPLPAVAARLMGTPHVSFEQNEWIDNERLSLEWVVKSPIGGDRFRAKGTYRVLPAIPGCERVVQGEIRVAVPLVGGPIEKQIVAEIKHSYDRAAEVLLRWLQEGRTHS